MSVTVLEFTDPQGRKYKKVRDENNNIRHFEDGRPISEDRFEGALQETDTEAFRQPTDTVQNPGDFEPAARMAEQRPDGTYVAGVDAPSADPTVEPGQEISREKAESLWEANRIRNSFGGAWARMVEEGLVDPGDRDAAAARFNEFIREVELADSEFEVQEIRRQLLGY